MTSLLWVVDGVLSGSWCVEVYSFVGCDEMCMVICMVAWVLSFACFSSVVLWGFASFGIFCADCLLSISIPLAL